VDVTAALAEVRRRVASTGRPADEVRIVAVTKGFGPEAVRAAVAADLLDCGENQAQSLLAKVDDVPDGVRWHFLGPVQRNKVKALAPHVALWHGLDREAAGVEVARRHPGAAVLVQVNVAEDPARPGCGWDEAAPLVARLQELGLEVRGLMAVASPDLAAARRQFRRLAALGWELGLPELSMGMSGDLEVAVEEGATIVRIGTALFGARPGTAQVRR
jgi:pyridoxal phosphate enzyme (YggS family)